MELSKSPDLPKNIKKMARELVEKWSRVVFDISTSYSDIDSENLRYEQVYGKRKRDREEDEFSSDEEKENIKSQKIETSRKYESSGIIPKKGLFDFTIKPKSNLDHNKSENSFSYGRINFFDTKKGGRKKSE